MSIPNPIRQGRPCRIAIPEAAARPYAALYATVDGVQIRATKSVRTQRDIHGSYMKLAKFPVFSGYPKRVHWNDSHEFFIGLLDKRATNSDGSPSPVDYLQLQGARACPCVLVRSHPRCFARQFNFHPCDALDAARRMDRETMSTRP